MLQYSSESIQMIRILTSILIITILISKCNAARYALDDFDDTGDKRGALSFYLRKRLNQLESDDSDDEDSFYRRAVTNTQKKCTEAQQSTRYSGGDNGPAIKDLTTYQDCMNRCEADDMCYRWNYNPSSKICRLQSSLGFIQNDASFISGSCLALAIKNKNCQERLPGITYSGNFYVESAATIEDCIRKCSIDQECYVWSYRNTSKMCQRYMGGGPVERDGRYTGGSCIPTHPRYPPIPLETFRQQGLDQHNFYRRKHCTPPLVLNASLNEIAQAYAETIAAAGIFDHSGAKFRGQHMGENIFLFEGSKDLVYNLEGSTPVAVWYNEIRNYNWSNPGSTASGETGHFTQVLWQNTKAVGIGRAFSRDQTKSYVVGNYFPGGNVRVLRADRTIGYESYPQNVKPLC